MVTHQHDCRYLTRKWWTATPTTGLAAYILATIHSPDIGSVIRMDSNKYMFVSGSGGRRIHFHAANSGFFYPEAEDIGTLFGCLGYPAEMKRTSTQCSIKSRNLPRVTARSIGDAVVKATVQLHMHNQTYRRKLFSKYGIELYDPLVDIQLGSIHSIPDQPENEDA